MNPPSRVNRDSIRAKLRNRARALGLPPDQMLLLYSLEGFLARLSSSPYVEQLVLKGGLSLYSRFGSLARPTRDIDLVMREAIQTPEQGVKAIKAIAQIEIGDGLEFDLTTLTLRELGEAAEGLGISLVARFGESRQTVQMDLSSGSAITPGPVELGFPTLLGDIPHKLWMYPLETVVAEKYAAAIELGVGNTRLKDFYDLWYILRQDSFETSILRRALERTFAARGTTLEGSLIRWAALAEHEPLVRLWRPFLDRNRLEATDDFTEVIHGVAAKLAPVLGQEGVL